MSRAPGPTVINGIRIVRLREVHTPMPPFDMVTWRVTDLHGRKTLFGCATREGCAKWTTEQGWRYLGSQVSA